jgi:hypothetical protein
LSLHLAGPKQRGQSRNSLLDRTNLSHDFIALLNERLQFFRHAGHNHLDIINGDSVLNRSLIHGDLTPTPKTTVFFIPSC